MGTQLDTQESTSAQPNETNLIQKKEAEAKETADLQDATSKEIAANEDVGDKEHDDAKQQAKLK